MFDLDQYSCVTFTFFVLNTKPHRSKLYSKFARQIFMIYFLGAATLTPIQNVIFIYITISLSHMFHYFSHWNFIILWGACNIRTQYFFYSMFSKKKCNYIHPKTKYVNNKVQMQVLLCDTNSTEVNSIVQSQGKWRAIMLKMRYC